MELNTDIFDMFSYITSVLSVNFQRPWGGPATRSVDISNKEMYVSCKGYGLISPDPAIRLRISHAQRHPLDSEVRVFGYPPPEDSQQSAPFLDSRRPPALYLFDVSPAYVNYVMGDDWHAKLRSDYNAPPLYSWPNSEVIVRPSEPSPDNNGTMRTTEEEIAEERAHCLRMRRCGAVSISEIDDVEFLMESRRECQSRLFGWPERGGVWTLRRPRTEHSDEEWYRMTDDDRRESAFEDSRRCDRYFAAREKMRQLQSMEDLCRVLEEAGAQYYENVADCPEAVALDLVGLRDLE